MKDKEKQIEEMAKIMCGNDCEECAKESAEFYKQTLEEARNNKCLLKNCAKTLYEQGYRKIPEDSVVLSRDNYNRLKRDSELYEARHKEKLKLFARAYNQGGKETAEKILNEITYFAERSLKIYGCIEEVDFEVLCNELALRFGVQIKE